MTETITVPLGPNASLDGGPFFGFTADPERSGDGKLVGEDEDGNESSFTIEEIEDAIADEMLDDEPVSISSGDVGTAPGGDEDITVGTIEVPMVRGYVARIHDLPGQGKDVRAGLAELAHSVSGRRHHFEKNLRRHGGLID